MNYCRIIPIVLISDGRVVKTTRFRSAKYIGSPVNTVKMFSDFGADELIVLDINTSNSITQKIDFRLFELIAKHCQIPLGFGGGIGKLSQALQLIRTGCEKVVINSANFRNPNLIKEVSEVIGSQAVVGAVDYMESRNCAVYDNGRQSSTFSPLDWSKELVDRGAGELLLTSIERDGTFSGLDWNIFGEVSKQTSTPIILSGGFHTTTEFQRRETKQIPSGIGVGSSFLFQNRTKGGVVVHYRGLT